MRHFFRLLSAILILLAPVVSSADVKMPDTGIEKCYSNTGEITCPEEGWPFYGQDAHYQGTQPSFQDNLDGTVTDLTTGLVWDKSDDGVRRNWQDAFDYCINRNAKLPSLYQLETIVDYTKEKPAIAPEFTAQPTSEYWTKTTIKSGFPDLPDSAWLIHFYKGRSVLRDKEEYEQHYVRCVRGDWDLGQEDYIRFDDDGVTMDLTTNLLWQTGKGEYKTWQEALAYCEGLDLDYRTWRLPNIRELRSIIRATKTYPAIDTENFDTEQDSYWTATTVSEESDNAWSVDFESGKAWTTEGSKSNYHYARCVAHGAALKHFISIFWDSYQNPKANVKRDPPGIDCTVKDGFDEENCKEFYDAGTEVKLTVDLDLPVDSYKCTWEGYSSCDPESTCTITMDKSRIINLKCEGLNTAKPIPSAINLLLLGID